MALHVTGRLARRRGPAGDRCPIDRTLQVVGSRSAFLLLREAFYGATRFEELVRLTGFSEAVAAKRLKELVAHDLLEQRPYREAGQRTRQEYVLTPKGEDALPVLNAVTLWAEKHLPAPSDQAHLYVIHSGCGKATSSADTCTECGERLTAANTSWHSRSRSEQPIRLSTAAGNGTAA